jgi:transposase
VVHYFVIGRLMQRLQATGMVDECPRSGKPRKSTPREDTLIARCARRNRFSTSDRNRDELKMKTFYTKNSTSTCKHILCN